MQTIVVTNRKGGVGKTTIATHLASGLALRGYRVALVDTDAQGHCALAFGMPKENGLFSIMTDASFGLSDVLREVPFERYAPPDAPVLAPLFLLPSDKATVMIPSEQPSPFRFREVLDDMGELLDLDFVVIDTGPTASMFDGSVNFAANYFLYVTECAWLSYDGITESLTEIEAMNRSNIRYRDWHSQVLGVIPNKVRARTSNHRENIAALAQNFPNLSWPPLRLATVWETAMDHGQMIYSFAPGTKENREMWSIVTRMERAIYATA